MRMLSLAALSLGAAALSAQAKYRMPPIAEVLRTAPIIVDATVTAIDPKTGAVDLKVHHEFRGLGAIRLTVSKTYLSCTGGAPGHYGAEAGKRYVFILQSEDTLYEASTFYPVLASPDEPESWRVLFRGKPAPGEKPGLSRADFARLLQPGFGASK